MNTNMQKFKRYIPFIGIAVIVILLTIGFIIWKNQPAKDITPADENTGEVVDEETPVEEEVVEQIPEEYKNLLKTAQGHINNKEYTKAVSVLKDAIKVYEDHQVYIKMYAAYDYLNDLEGKRFALSKITQTFGLSDSTYWIEYAIVLQQLNANVDVIEKVYQDGLALMKSVSGTGISHLVNMQTAYARYLVGIEEYSKAIVQLQNAKAIDGDRSAIYDQEIATLEAKLKS